MAKKRKISPKHLAALRAAGRKRRGKKRGPYGKRTATKVNPIEKLFVNPVFDNTEFRRLALYHAVSHFTEMGLTKETVLPFAEKMYQYLMSGKLPEIDIMTKLKSKSKPKPKPAPQPQTKPEGV